MFFSQNYANHQPSDIHIVEFIGGPADGHRISFRGLLPFEEFAYEMQGARTLLYRLSECRTKYAFAAYLSEPPPHPDAILGPIHLSGTVGPNGPEQTDRPATPGYDVVTGPE